MFGSPPVLFAVWYNWIIPLWVVAAGTLAATALFFAVYYTIRFFAPKVAAIAHTTAKESYAQPLFWVALVLGVVLLAVFPFLPYNTLGDDLKMVKTEGLTLITVLTIFVSVWTASESIAVEIEGRTALTLLSKPVGRRQFILGKFLGVIGPVASIFIVLGAIFLATVSFKVKHEARENSEVEPSWQECQAEMIHVVPGLVLAFLETVTLTSITVALSTRLPLVPNLVICTTIYFLGHLTPQFANAYRDSKLVAFFGQFIATVLPNLDDFTVEAAVTTGNEIRLEYVGVAALYCALYSTVAMFLALVLFEDRDLA